MMAEPAHPDLRAMRFRWLLGDWEPLASLCDADLTGHADRADLAMLASAGSQQLGRIDEARRLADLAVAWGCPAHDVAKMLLAGVHHTIAGACALSGDSFKRDRHLRLSISTAPGSVDDPVLASVRMPRQILRLRGSSPAAAEPAEPFAKPDRGIRSYAQNFEDVMLWRALGRIEGGLYIDIGAQDPIVDSVSRAFFENGWRGIHVEPTPGYAAMLRDDRPGETVVQAAVSTTAGSIHFFEIPETGISTGDPAIAAAHERRGFAIRPISVPTVTMSDVLAMAGGREIHWLKIDVEGMEGEVLSGWQEADPLPWIMVVESTLPLTQTESFQAWEPILLARGYLCVYFDGLNRFYLSPAHWNLAAAFRFPPNVFDDFSLNRYLPESH